MPKRIYPKHVQKHGNHVTYLLSIAGERVQGGLYQTHTIAAYEAELVKRYVRARYCTKVAAMRPAVPEADLQIYAIERGYNLDYPEIFEYLPRHIREMFTERGDEIGRNFAELEPHPLREILVTEGRKERQQFKLDRIEAQKTASLLKAEAWKQAQIAVAEAWKNTKIDLELFNELKACLRSALDVGYPENGWQTQAEDIFGRCKPKRTPLGGVRITREQALEGLGDPATWEKDSESIYRAFRKKPEVS